jgi:hypothetical protein
MKAPLHSAAVIIAAIALAGCPGKRPEPLPGPQSGPSSHAAGGKSAVGKRGAAEISWFQGTLEEAFSRHNCQERRSWLHL